MGINVNMDYSTLFSSMSAQSSSSGNYLSNLSGMLSDYSSIKNGSYGKLVSAYYKKIDSENSSATSKTKEDKAERSAASSKSNESKKYSSMAQTAKDVQSDIGKLTDSSSKSVYEKEWQDIKGEDGSTQKVFDYNTSKITSAVSSFVKNYNSLISAASDASDTTTSTRASYMQKITNSFKSELSAIGINVDDNGKLSLDKDKMKEAGMESVKNVMGSRSGYGYQISSAASLIESSATHAASQSKTYSANGSFNSDISSILDSFV
ncbi:MAG: hypothetical protein E7301_08355 [Butyrivibrio sp.]|jgi:hypothetical protein|nr:hypothetical protein [Butyrivibrio sp.]